ncbi:hypothetical protein At1D1609_39830 [Agrobacterium tumefaciens]|uniref:Secreted protein n=1 Tax=Agrobacterium tumefaciens TaxID=358 RepID=A0A2L2LI70_AGRTU|nr:hypothetical protein At1D1609_39830 [Agrobacterium tumefaciens]
MLRLRLWLLSLWSGQQSLFAPTTIAGAATRQETTRGIAIPTTTELRMAVYVAIEARCRGLAAGDWRDYHLMSMSMSMSMSVRTLFRPYKLFEGSQPCAELSLLHR